MLWTVRYDYEPGWRLKEHRHNYHQFFYILDGEGKFIINDHSFSVTKAKLFYIKPNQIHGLTTDDKTTIKTLDMKFNVRDDELKGKMLYLPGEIVIEGQRIPKLFEKVRKEGLKKESFYYDLSVVYFMNIIFRLLRRYFIRLGKDELEDGQVEALETLETQENTGGNSVSEGFINYIQAHYSEDLQLKDIAKELGYNQSYICQCLKNDYQCTPMKYLYKFRIKKAKELITTTDYSLKEISRLAGFKTIHHFSRLFKEFEGITPGDFRDKERKGIRKDIYFGNRFVNKDITIKNT